MPEWLKALCIFSLLAWFIYKAFCKGFQVKPGPKQDGDGGSLGPDMHAWRRAFTRHFFEIAAPANPTGKSLPIYGSHVKSQNKKYFAFAERQISARTQPIPS